MGADESKSKPTGDRWSKAKDWVEVGNKVLVSLAIVIGGGWALYKYVTGDSPSAKLQATELERYCSQRGSLDIRIDANSSEKTIWGKVSLKNSGTRTISIEQVKPVSIVKLDVVAGHKLAASKISKAILPYVYDGEIEHSSDRVIVAGRTLDLHFVQAVESTGYYLLSFDGGPRNTVASDVECKKQEKDIEGNWGAEAIIYVSDKKEDHDTKLPAQRQ